VTRRPRRIAAATLLAACALGAFAAPAAAHAELVSSTPTPGEILDRSPAAIELRYTESVETSPDAVRVFDGRGDRIDTGSVRTPERTTVRVGLPELPAGSYIVTWRVTSADSHPIRGAFTFQVGAGTNATSQELRGLTDKLLEDEQSDGVLGALYGIARWLVFAGIALLVGTATFSVIVWRHARTSRRARRIGWTGWATLAVGTILGGLVYGPYSRALPTGDIIDLDVVVDTFGTRFGQMALLRLVLLAIAAVLLPRLFRAAQSASEPDPLPRWWLATAGVTTIGIVMTPGIAGHAATGDLVALALPVDAFHLLAMSIWFGGLVVLSGAVLPGGSVQGLAAVLPRFSRTALICVAVLIATGTFQAWRQLGSLDAFRDTEFGRILVIKLIVFGVLLVVAMFSRNIVTWLYAPPLDEAIPVVAGGADDHPEPTPEELESEVRRLRINVAVEVILAVAVLAASTLLVNAPPGTTALASTADGVEVGTVYLQSPEADVDIAFTPGTAGLNTVHVTVTGSTGTPIEVDNVTVTIALPEQRIPDLDIPLRRLSPGHYYAPSVDIPLPGTWAITVKVLLSDFEQPILKGKIAIQ